MVENKKKKAVANKLPNRSFKRSLALLAVYFGSKNHDGLREHNFFSLGNFLIALTFCDGKTG